MIDSPTRMQTTSAAVSRNSRRISIAPTFVMVVPGAAEYDERPEFLGYKNQDVERECCVMWKGALVLTRQIPTDADNRRRKRSTLIPVSGVCKRAVGWECQ